MNKKKLMPLGWLVGGKQGGRGGDLNKIQYDDAP